MSTQPRHGQPQQGPMDRPAQHAPQRQAPPPGWYPHGPVVRWWDGQQWTDHVQHHVQQQPQVVVVQGGGGPQSMVHGGVSNGEHVFHVVMTICTIGLWAPIWLWRTWATKKTSTFRY